VSVCKTVAAAEKDLREAFEQRLEVAPEACSDATRASADFLVDLAIERLILAALAVGRPDPREVVSRA
jgi:hypothetical protein